MGLLDFFKKSERVYIKEEDKYTGLIRYYECIINNKEANARILERCPKNAHIVDFELGKIHPILECNHWGDIIYPIFLLLGASRCFCLCIAQWIWSCSKI